jgi:hypothetical protein
MELNNTNKGNMPEQKRRNNLATKAVYQRRIWTGIKIAAVVLTFSMGIGVAGYHWLCDLGWVDSILNASMILTGMGPVNVMTTNTSKLFASAYAIYSGVMFLTTIAIVLAPIMHRVMHRFHIDDTESD